MGTILRRLCKLTHSYRCYPLDLSRYFCDQLVEQSTGKLDVCFRRVLGGRVKM